MPSHKADSPKVYRYEGVLERFEGKGGWHYVSFPYNVAEEFGKRVSVRVQCTFNGLAVDRSLMPKGDGTHMLVLSTDMRRKAGLRVGNRVDVTVILHDEPDKVDLPEEMQLGFDMAPEAFDAWNELPVNLRRGLCDYVNTGKRAETREQRAGMLIQRLVDGYYKPEARKSRLK